MSSMPRWLCGFPPAMPGSPRILEPVRIGRASDSEIGTMSGPVRSRESLAVVAWRLTLVIVDVKSRRLRRILNTPLRFSGGTSAAWRRA